MTNGEKMQEMFPEGKTRRCRDGVVFESDGWCHAYGSEWWNAEYKEPIPKNDLEVEKAIEIIKADSLAPYSVNDILSARDLAVEALKQMATTKNDLGVDCIDRAEVLKAMDTWDKFGYLAHTGLIRLGKEQKYFVQYVRYEDMVNCVKGMPSVTPQESRWIPVSEKLPNDRDWYLGIFKEPDTGWINPLPFICDYVGRETKATTKEYWILHGFTDMDEHIDYYFNLECVKWMPLPQPYREVKE